MLAAISVIIACTPVAELYFLQKFHGYYDGRLRINNIKGSVQWYDNGSFREIRRTAGFSSYSTPSSIAYGAFYFKVNCGAGAGPYLCFIASADASPLAATQNGYAWASFDDGSALLYRDTGGGLAALLTLAAGTVPAAAFYEVFITRRPRDGRFDVWTRSIGGVWMLQGNATNNTHTTSAFMCCMEGAGGNHSIGEVTVYPNGDSLLPTEVPSLM
jgi:hypothetical protein